MSWRVTLDCTKAEAEALPDADDLFPASDSPPVIVAQEPDETKPDECVGRMARWVKSLVCYGPPSPESGGALAPDDSPYECYMGVDLKNGSLALGNDC